MPTAKEDFIRDKVQQEGYSYDEAAQEWYLSGRDSTISAATYSAGAKASYEQGPVAAMLVTSAQYRAYNDELQKSIKQVEEIHKNNAQALANANNAKSAANAALAAADNERQKSMGFGSSLAKGVLSVGKAAFGSSPAGMAALTVGKVGMNIAQSLAAPKQSAGGAILGTVLKQAQSAGIPTMGIGGGGGSGRGGFYSVGQKGKVGLSTRHGERIMRTPTVAHLGKNLPKAKQIRRLKSVGKHWDNDLRTLASFRGMKMVSKGAEIEHKKGRR